MREENEMWVKKHAEEITSWRNRYNSTVKNLKEEFAAEIDKLKKIFSVENEVQKHIIDRQMIDVVQNRFKIERLRGLLRIPGLSCKAHL